LRVSDEAHNDSRPCPCCGKPLPLGLFSKHYEAGFPWAAERIEQDGELSAEISDALADGGLVEIAGRFFVRAEMPLPVSLPESPVRARVWVEIPADNAALLLVTGPQGVASAGEGHLASELPGFPGLIGSPCAWELPAGANELVIRWCADERIDQLPEHPDHDQLAGIYRMLWGNPGPVVPDDPELRAAVISHWHETLERPLYRKPIEPPPMLSGYRAPELAVGPPLDTGGDAVLATIGCSEQPGPAGERVEIVGWADDPSEEFIRSFSEFCFISRLSDEPLGHGRVVPERRVIPGTEGMHGWLLVDPPLLGEERHERVGEVIPSPSGEVKVLAAIPLHPAEMALAAGMGPKALFDLFERTGHDPLDLAREPALKPIGSERESEGEEPEEQ